MTRKAPTKRGAKNEDSARLDWLDSKKSERHAHWGGGPRYDDATSWVNPSASWSLRHEVEDGTYKYPPELSKLSIRAAIDVARGLSPDLAAFTCASSAAQPKTSVALAEKQGGRRNEK